MRRLAQRRNPIQMTEFQELVQQTHATATEWQPSTVNLRRPARSDLAARLLKVIDAVPERTHLSSLRTPLALLAVSLSFIAGVWWWIAQPINLSRPPIDASTRLDCVSYAPFRGQQNPLDPGMRVPDQQIAEDLAQLSRITNCVRTYSVDNGVDRVPALAEKAGLKVIHGIWIGSDRLKNRQQIDATVALAKEYPGVITAIVVGNEVLLRGEMTATDLASYIRSVKAQVTGIPVTYADVWEYWLRHREIYEAVDFITIHILPYWEDFPIRARYAAAHVDSIRKRVAVAFPGKEILIGETGWPSTGRMREGALPSRSNQARVVSEVLELAKREKYRVNLIEAYDQPWKRQLEGTVGGYWGLFDADKRAVKYPPGQAINNFPAWKWQMGVGMTYATFVFLVALLTQRRKPWPPRWTSWVAVGLAATAGGALLGIAADKVLLESIGVGGWLRWGTLFGAAVLTPVFAAVALIDGRPLPTFIQLIGPVHLRDRAPLSVLLGLCLVVTVVIGLETALGFVFDARYRDFPFASLTMAALPIALVALLNRRADGVRPIAEAVFGGALVLSAAYIVINEGLANWQSVWTCAVYAGLGITMWRARGAKILESKDQSQSPTG
jgi:exo-beta-1,3-glucanase (GH17 family)